MCYIQINNGSLKKVSSCEKAENQKIHTVHVSVCVEIIDYLHMGYHGISSWQNVT